MTIAFPKPDEAVLARRKEIIAGLGRLVPSEALIVSEDERRAFETDGLTAYRQMPLAVALPSTTEEVSAIMRFCHEHGVKVVPRGAGTSLCGGAIPQEDAIVLGVAKMNRVLDINFEGRTARVQSGITNLGISQAVAHEGFFYAPDPSSQLACTIAGNIAMNSGGAHCLKYGVTTNNLLGVTMVLLDGTVVEIGGEHLDAPGYDLLGLICGSEGQLGVVTEAVVRILRAAEGARPALMGFSSVEDAGACVAAIIGAGIIPVALEYMDKPAIQICEAFAHAGYPLDVEAMLIVEVEGSDQEIDDMLRRIVAIAEPFKPKTLKVSQSEAESAAIWKGRKSAFGATGRVADYICMDGTIPTGQLPYVLKRIDEIAKSYGLGVANVFHAGDGNLHPLVMFNTNVPGEMEKAEKAGEDILRLCVEVGGCLTGEHGVGIEKRDLMTCQFNEADLAQQMRVRGVFDPLWLLNPAKVFPLEGSRCVTNHLPRDEQDASAIIREASEKGILLSLSGQSTKAEMGRPNQTDASISSGGMTGITLYEPAEMVISAKSGTPVSEVVRTLAEKGQELPFEPMDYRPLLGTRGEPTIGAVAAMNISGPRRIMAGAARDSLIGVRFVNGRGEVVKSGGRVMKNVTGLDLVKLMAGSWGTLGFLTEVTFKVLPKQERMATLVLRGLKDEKAVEALSQALGSPFDVTGAAHIPARDRQGASTLIRLEGFSVSVDYRLGELRRLLKPFGGSTDILEGRGAEAVWQSLRDATVLTDGADRAIWRISVPPMKGPEFAKRIAQSLDAQWFYDWGGGLIWMSTPADSDAGASVLREMTRELGGHASLMRAPAEIRSSVDVFEPQNEALMTLSKGIKASFDPAGILNPGRMYVGI